MVSKLECGIVYSYASDTVTNLLSNPWGFALRQTSAYNFIVCHNLLLPSESVITIRQPMTTCRMAHGVYMSEWVSEWVSECVCACVHAWVSAWVSEWVRAWVSECVSEWVSECVRACVSECVSEWVSECVCVCAHDSLNSLDCHTPTCPLWTKSMLKGYSSICARCQTLPVSLIYEEFLVELDEWDSMLWCFR